MTGPFKRGYATVFAALDEIEPKAKARGNQGVWSLQQGEQYYANRLRASTTTDLTADQIHQLGLRQVAAIRQELEAVKARVGFKGSLEEFFQYVRTDPRFKYPNTDAGREAYLGDARAFIAEMMAAAPRYFSEIGRASCRERV